MERKGILTVVSGFSGAGKGTLIKKLMEKHGQAYALSVSATTRKPRPGEAEGKDYFFKTKPEFAKMVAGKELIEYAEYVGNFYGTPRLFVEQMLVAGKDVILEIDTRGGFQVKKHFPDSLLVFVTTPSAVELKTRLLRRGTESYEAISSRLAHSLEEVEAISWYEYLLVNNDLEQCAKELHRIIQSEHFRCSRNGKFIEEIKKELENLLKN